MATIVGTDGDDTLLGTSGPDVIVGLGGWDTIDGGDGDDVVCSGPTPIRFDVEGFIFREPLFGGDGSDVIVAGAGGPGELDGGRGDDTLIGQHGTDILFGDVLSGRSGDDLLIGSAGDDSLTGSGGKDALFGRGGADEIHPGRGGGTARGGAGDDRLYGSREADVLRGGAGADALNGNRGNDRLIGGPGSDAADYRSLDESFATIDVTVDLRVGNGGGGRFGRDRLIGVEGAWTGSGSDTFVGNRRNNVFFPGTGRAVMRGGAGMDTLLFGVDVDLSCCEPLFVDLASGRGRLPSGPLRLRAVENVTGGRGRDVIRGNDRPNRLIGGQGSSDDSDVIDGRGGDDVVRGAGGSDQLTGGPGDDLLRGAAGDDDLAGGRGSDTNVGGPGDDRCTSPASGASAVGCERARG